MAGLSKVNINVGTTGLGFQAPNQDKISGLLSFNANLPAGFSTTNRVQLCNSLQDAINLGIVSGSTNFAVEYYHISEFFRLNPQGQLYVGIYVADYTFVAMATMLIAAGGNIRQLGIYAPARVWTPADPTLIQSVLNVMDAGYQQTSILLAENFAAITTITGWTALAAERALTANRVSIILAQDGGGAGLALYTAKGYSITALGAALGVISSAGVEESIGNPARFPITDGVELNILALANGDLVTALSSTTMAYLKDNGYLIARYYAPDLTGSFFERCPTCCPFTNNFAWLELNRMIAKLIRGVRTALTPALQGTIYLQSNGTLSPDSVGYYKDLAQAPCDAMVANGEVSAIQILVNPNQNVFSTSTLIISGTVVPVGIAEFITFDINLATSISN